MRKLFFLSNITFLYSGFLWGLSLISIPIIIHLFNFKRYKTIYFSNVTFLESVKEQTKFASQLKHFLILLTRIFAILFLVLAFAQPYIPLENQKKTTNDVVSVYIDNSFSMRAQPQKGTQLDIAIMTAKNLSDGLPDDIHFSLLTNDYLKTNLTKQEFIDAIKKIDFSASYFNLSNVIKDAKTINGTTELFVISDFQKIFFNTTEISNDSVLNTFLIPLKAQNIYNLSVDSCWVENPVNKSGEQVILHFRIQNFSDEKIKNLSVKLFINDSLKAMTKLDVDSNKFTKGAFDYINPDSREVIGKIQITDYPILFDNELLFSYRLSNQNRVLNISEDFDNYFNKVFEDDNHFDVEKRNLTNLSYNDFDQFDIIIINRVKQLPEGLLQTLEMSLKKGKNILFVPAIDGDLDNYNQFLSLLNAGKLMSVSNEPITIENIETKSTIFKNVFKQIDKHTKMPIVNQYYIHRNHGVSSGKVYLSSENHHSLFIDFTKTNGHFYLLNVPDNETNESFYFSPVFVPMLYNLATASTNSDNLYFVMNQNISLEVQTNTQSENGILRLTSVSSQTNFIPYQQDLNNKVRIIIGKKDIHMQDYYMISNEDENLQTLSMNYSRNESDMSYFSTDELKDYFLKNNITSVHVLDSDYQTIAESIKQVHKGIELWRWMLLIALLFIIIEIFVLRFMK